MANYLHSRSLPIIRSAKFPDKNKKNIFTAYLFVFFSFIIMGTFGYVCFMGVDFSWYFIAENKTDLKSQIAQNCLNMFDYDNVLSIVVRIAVFFELFAIYPILNLFLRTQLLNIFFTKETVDKCDLVVLNILVTIIPLSFACIYPNIGHIMSYTGAFFGTISMYFLPVLVHLKKRYT